MGLDINAVQFLIDARKRGVDFGEVLTLGRQDLNVYPARMVEVLESHGFPATAFKGGDKVLHAEPCFLSMGARKVSAMDFSDFEGANHVHDLNKPVGVELKERFDLVYDGGTLEHVFNFPVALKNCMEMVRLGGHLFFHTCTNNYCGHGFYQFSPELFYRALSPENGFEVTRMVLHRVGPYAAVTKCLTRTPCVRASNSFPSRPCNCWCGRGGREWFRSLRVRRSKVITRRAGSRSGPAIRRRYPTRPRDPRWPGPCRAWRGCSTCSRTGWACSAPTRCGTGKASAPCTSREAN